MKQAAKEGGNLLLETKSALIVATWGLKPTNWIESDSTIDNELSTYNLGDGIL